MIKNPLNDNGIYYKHDEENILQGYAYICGPSDSQYVGGNYFFKFMFPYDYPHQPPTVVFMTSDGITRFHPNMYKNGKICLSILNKWRGEPWTGCQSIRTILLTLISIMDNFPLLHEPGFSIKHIDVKNYNEIILFQNLSYCVTDTIQHINNTSFKYTNLFKDNIIVEFKNKYKEILSILEGKRNEPYMLITTGIYGMRININWNILYNKFIKIEI